MKKYLFPTLAICFLGMFIALGDQVWAQNFYTIDEIYNHQVPEDCWMAIEGKVYDLSAYLPNHDRWLDIREWCGEDATQDYNDKAGLKRGHSPKAKEMLSQYFIGELSLAGEESIIDMQQAPSIQSEEIKVDLISSKNDLSENPDSNFAPKYKVFLPTLLTVICYLLSKKFLKKSKHDFFWNSVLLLGFIPLVGFGFILALADQVPFLAKINFSQILGQHAQLSIIIATAMVLHFIQRVKIYLSQGKSALRKKN